jgi:CP family cyanate transporter-like MFS transporter
MGRFRDQRTIVAVVTAAAFVGFAGIGWAPIASAWLWAVILGLSHGAGFSLALSLMGLRAHDHHVAVSLSGMAQTVGYLLAAIGPFGVGALHDLTGGWGVPTLVLLTLVALQAVVGMGVGRARLVGARSVPVLPVV